MQNSLKKNIADEFKDSEQFSLFEAYESFPEKADDHAMDDIRFFVSTILNN